jgi:hypothetical protein
MLPPGRVFGQEYADPHAGAKSPLRHLSFPRWKYPVGAAVSENPCYFEYMQGVAQRIRIGACALVWLFMTPVAHAQDLNSPFPPGDEDAAPAHEYWGPHPDGQGGWCPIEGVHAHAYLPFDPYLFTQQGDVYYFIGDPSDFGYAGPLYDYYGVHPIEVVYGGGYCFATGYHHHFWAPGAYFYVSDGWYWYGGPFSPWFYEYWPRYRDYYRSVYPRYPGHYGGVHVGHPVPGPRPPVVGYSVNPRAAPLSPGGYVRPAPAGPGPGWRAPPRPAVGYPAPRAPVAPSGGHPFAAPPSGGRRR